MKKLFYNVNNYLLLVLLASAVLTQSSCKKDASVSSEPTPVIKAVRSYVASPGDSLLSTVGTGKWVVISGQNLKGALSIYFDGVKGSFNDVWFSDTSAIVLIPSIIAFPSVPTDKLNTIRYVSTHGETTFSFSIVAPPPTITSVSNEDANPGDSVKIYGFNLFFVKNLTYAGTPITSYTSANDGTSLGIVVPAGLTTSGNVSVTTKSGTATSLFVVNDFVTGVLNNYDAVNNFSWGSPTSTSSATYPGNNGKYGIIGATNLNAYDYGWYNWPRGVNLNGAQWVPVANLSTGTLDSYAVKFEISVTKPWTNGSLYILKDYSWTYLAAYHPWKNADGSTTPFTTNGWQTVTIPLSEFRTNNGSGLPAASLTTLLGGSGKGSLNVWFINDGASKVTTFEAAVDNMRVVKIK